MAKMKLGVAAVLTVSAVLTVTASSAAGVPPTAAEDARTVIVVLRATSAPPAVAATAMARARGGTVVQVYEHALRGFALRLPARAAEALLASGGGSDPQVEFVEAETAMRTVSTAQSPTPSWGLDRIDQRARPLDSTYRYADGGMGVRAYVVDTGIRPTHIDLHGRVAPGYSFYSGGSADCNGHGTHVAGTVGGTSYGVAKQVTLVPVRVLDCNGSGSTTGVIAGLDWVAAQTHRPAVVNMSLGGGASDALDLAVRNVVGRGMAVVVAAGNSNADACRSSPAREPLAITVGATTSSDARASYSNFGTCLDLFAPGSGITSAWWTSDTAAATLNGTSMAAPHVAGVAALMLATAPTSPTTPADIEANLKGSASPNLVSSAGRGSPNLLLFADWANSYQPPAPPPATFVHVQDLTGTSARNGRNWRATVTITVHSSGGPVGGAVVTGSFTHGGTGLQCTTDSLGRCNVTSGSLGTNVSSTTFGSVTLSGSSLQHDPNNDLKKDVLVNRP
jgi:aqualysin 1